MFFTFAGYFRILFADNPRLLGLRSALPRELLVQCCDALETRRSLIRDRPLPEEEIDPFSNISVDCLISS